MSLKLRYIILFVAACGLLSSCGPSGEDVAQGSEMTFVVSDLSRASVTTNINYTDSKFAVYGDMTFKDNSPIKVFDGDIVTYRGGKWEYNNAQYWFPQHEHSFIAMHPVEAKGMSAPEYSRSWLSYNYTLPTDFTEAKDLMVATHRRMAEANPAAKATPVALKFFHVMSRVNFLLTNAGAADIVRVNEIKLEGVNRTGTFAIIPSPLLSGSQTDDFDFTWSGISDIGNVTASIRVDVPENEALSLFPDDNALFMIPQPDNNGVIMHINYTLIDAGANDEQLTLTAQAPIGGWEAGKIYTYSLSVSEITKEMYLTVSVKDWQAPKQPTTITVPES